MSESALPGNSTKQTQRPHDTQANTLDLDTDVNFRETAALVWRALTYIRFFPVRYATKFFLMWVSLLTPLILPWPIKIVIDNVILQRAVEPEAFPVYFAPFVAFLAGMSPFEMMSWVLLLGVVMLITIGGFGSGAGANDQASAFLAEGHDTATKTENDANMAVSKFAGLVGYAEFKLQIRLTQSLNHLLRAQLFERIQNLPMPLLDDQRIGDSLFRVMYDTTAIQNIFFQAIMSPVLAICTLFVVLIVMAFNYGDAPEVIYLALLALPVYFIAMLPFPRLLRRRSQASREAGSETTGNIEEGMSNVLAVQALGGNKHEQARFDRHSKESFRRFRAEALVSILHGGASRIAGILLGMVAFYFISTRVIEGVLSPGDYGVLLYYYGWMSGAVSALPYAWLRLQADVPGVRRVFFLMDLPSETDRIGREFHGLQDNVCMEHVGFTYPDGRRALHDVNLTMKLGEITALVGPTGAGKTSLAYLLPSFHPPSQGRVLFDGVDANELSLTSLRREVSYVFQETQLFSDSIMDNIRYGNPDATLADVERVARIAGAHEFISDLHDGYETLLGTVTSKLSVGQKQRIAIARGLLKPASILVLDEPTSALDPETEAYLVQALEEAAKHKLVVIIAHRLSTIAHAHNIVFLEDGEVREQGSHEGLMALPDGHYKRFVDLQSSANT